MKYLYSGVPHQIGKFCFSNKCHVYCPLIYTRPHISLSLPAPAETGLQSCVFLCRLLGDRKLKRLEFKSLHLAKLQTEQNFELHNFQTEQNFELHNFQTEQNFELHNFQTEQNFGLHNFQTEQHFGLHNFQTEQNFELHNFQTEQYF